jgi:hypothetical protein
MRMIELFFCVVVFFSLSVHASEDARFFSPAPGVKAEVTAEGQALTWKIYYRGGGSQGGMDVDTENTIHVDVNDYDFSGRLGFAVWHLDDGMGTYSIYRIFTFSPSTNKFIERSPASQCGDEFINLKIDKKRRRLFSTFWDQNVPKTCITRLSPLK